MENLVDIINNYYQNILQSGEDPKYHMFFDSHEWFLNSLKQWEVTSSRKTL